MPGEVDLRPDKPLQEGPKGLAQDSAPTDAQKTKGSDPDEAQRKADDQKLQAIGITRQQLIDWATMTHGDFIDKHGLMVWLRFPKDKVIALPADLLVRVLPKQDQTLYLQPSGRISTNADETARNLENFQPPATPLGGLLKGVALLVGMSPEAAEALGQAGDLAEALLPVAAASIAKNAAARGAQQDAPIQGTGGAGGGAKSYGGGLRPGQPGTDWLNPRDPESGRVKDTNCVACTAAVMKNVNDAKLPPGERGVLATADNIDPHNLTLKGVSRAGQALQFVARETGMQYDGKPIDMKNDRDLAVAKPGQYALIASNGANAHIVYAQKTDAGKFLVYDGQNATLYTMQEFRSQWANVAGYRFHN